MILETNGRRWKALSTVVDPEDVGGHGLVPAGTGEWTLGVEDELWFQLVTADPQPALCLLLQEGSRQQLLGCCIFALENKPRVTIPIE